MHNCENTLAQNDIYTCVKHSQPFTSQSVFTRGAADKENVGCLTESSRVEFKVNCFAKSSDF